MNSENLQMTVEFVKIVMITRIMLYATHANLNFSALSASWAINSTKMRIDAFRVMTPFARTVMIQ